MTLSDRFDAEKEKGERKRVSGMAFDSRSVTAAWRVADRNAPGRYAAYVWVLLMFKQSAQYYQKAVASNISLSFHVGDPPQPRDFKTPRRPFPTFWAWRAWVV